MKGNTMEHGQCLTEETLAEYLEGALDPAIKAASEVHLVACDRCRQRLGFFMHLLNEEVGDGEAAALQAITAEWDKKKAQKPRRTGTFKGWFLGFAAIAAVVIIGVTSGRIILDRAAEPKSAAEVVQLLLSQQRPFEPRLGGQPHMPIVRTRGADDPSVAYSLLASEMTRLSANTHQMGRFYLLQKDFNKAIAYLEMAEQEVGARADVHNDLGVAYLEGGGEARLQKAVQEFQHALDSEPAFAPAVFNLALYYERMGETVQAAAQWKRYLELDKDSPWAGEAQIRLKGLIR